MKLVWIPVDPRNIDKQASAEIDAAIDLVPKEFLESGSAKRNRLNLNALEGVKGDPVRRFDNPGEMFIVQIPGTYGTRLGLVYITIPTMFGGTHAVVIENGDANGFMFAQKGIFGSGGNVRDWNFFEIQGRTLHKNVPRVPAKAPPAPKIETDMNSEGVNRYDPVHGNPTNAGVEMERMIEDNLASNTSMSNKSASVSTSMPNKSVSLANAQIPNSSYFGMFKRGASGLYEMATDPFGMKKVVPKDLFSGGRKRTRKQKHRKHTRKHRKSSRKHK